MRPVPRGSQERGQGRQHFLEEYGVCLPWEPIAWQAGPSPIPRWVLSQHGDGAWTPQIL